MAIDNPQYQNHKVYLGLSAENKAKFDTLPNEVKWLFSEDNSDDEHGQPRYGSPDNISQAGCLALAKISNQGAEKHGGGEVLWNKWRELFPVVGKEKNAADFSKVKFINVSISFDKFNFGDNANFDHAEFNCAAKFNEARFGNKTTFINTQFYLKASFCAAQFGNWTDFIHAQFYDETYFIGITFGGNWTNFSGVEFDNLTYFNGAQFTGKVIFKDTTFNRSTYFSGQYLSSMSHGHYDEDFEQRKAWVEKRGISLTLPDIDFSGAIFKDLVDFSNRIFQGTTNFSNAQFSQAPEFHNATLHQDTSFEGAEFPPDDEHYQPQGADTMRAYRTLKLAFSKFDAKREEQRFFTYEMKEEHGLADPLWVLVEKVLVLVENWFKRTPAQRRNGYKSYPPKFYYSWYNALSGYGYSVLKPVLWLFFAALVMCYFIWACAYGHYNLDIQTLDWEKRGKLFGYVLNGMFPIFGEKFEALHTVLGMNATRFSRFVDLLSMTQKFCSLVFWFLIGLALRNQFKMK